MMKRFLKHMQNRIPLAHIESFGIMVLPEE